MIHAELQLNYRFQLSNFQVLKVLNGNKKKVRKALQS